MATSSVISPQHEHPQNDTVVHEHGLVLGADLKQRYELPLSGLFRLSGEPRAQRYAVFESNLTRASVVSQIQVVE
eukprot:COSAG03_NODE_7617_length_893_cov_1.693955_1_plen_74_part_10